jgi:tetratricopeptide (TPR) repeat protein
MLGAGKWLREALQGTDGYDAKRGSFAAGATAGDSNQMQIILEAWENPSSKFNEEMEMPIPRLLAGYTLISPSAATTPSATPRTPRGDDLTPRRSSAREGPGVGPRGSLVSPRGPADTLFNTPVPRSAAGDAAGGTDDGFIQEDQGKELVAPATEEKDFWRKVRLSVKGAAVHRLVDELPGLSGNDVLKTAMRLGYLLADVRPQVSAAILQNLHDRQFMGSQPGVFLEKLATAHTNAWFDSKGAGTTRCHAHKAKEAWDKALTHLSVAGNPASWAWTVAVTTSLGEFAESSDRLGTLTRSFPQIPNDPLAVIAMSASALLGELGHYDQACAYLYDSIEKGPPHPFSETDMSFYMARMTDRWGGGAKAENAFQVQSEQLRSSGNRDKLGEMYSDDGAVVPLPGTEQCDAMTNRRLTAQAAYRNCFQQLKLFEEDGVKNVRLMNADNHKDVGSWLRDARTWQCYAELANMGSMPVLSTDLYKECVKRDNASKAMHIHLAKAQRQTGQLEDCLESLRTSLGVTVGVSEGNTKSNAQALSWLKIWEDDEKQLREMRDVEGSKEAKGTHNVLRKRIKMNLKDLVRDAREEILGRAVATRGEDEVGEDGIIIPGSFKLKEHKRVALWKINRRDKARSLLFDWIKVGVKNAARSEVWKRVENNDATDADGDDNEGEQSIEIAALGVLSMNSPHNQMHRVSALLLEKAKLLGFDGNDGIATGVRKRQSTFLCSMQKGMTTARFRRAVAMVHSRLSDGKRAGQSYHALQFLKAAENSLLCEENAMRAACWMELVRAQIRNGALLEAKDGLKSLLKLHDLGPEEKAFACVVSASLRLNEGNSQGCIDAANDLTAGLKQGVGGGMLKRDLIFLSAFIAKKKADWNFAKECGLDGIESCTHEYDDSSLVLFEAVFDEEKAAQMKKTGIKKVKFGENTPTKSNEKKIVEFLSRSDILAPVIQKLKRWQTWVEYGKKCQSANYETMAMLLFRHAWEVATDGKSVAGERERMICARHYIRALYRGGESDSVGYFMGGIESIVGKEHHVMLKRVVADYEGAANYEREFLEELNRDDALKTMFQKYDVVNALPTKLPARPLTFFNNWKMHDAQNERRWLILKKGLRPVARALVIQQAMMDPSNADHLAQLGVLCSADSTRSAGTDRCACLLMQAAADLGHKGDAKFWRKLARCHMGLWNGSSHGMGGGGGERGHLEKADFAYTEAMKHLQNASGISLWLEVAEAKVCLGDYAASASTLNTLLRSLGSDVAGLKIPELSRVTLTAVEVLMELGKFEQAQGHLYDSIARGPNPPLSSMDLLFYSARLQGSWGESLMETAGSDEKQRSAAQQHLETSAASYAQVFRHCIESGDEVYGVSGDYRTAEEWLSNWAPWNAFGERAAMARHYLFAAHMFREGIRRDEAASTSNYNAWFSLAKAYRRCGRLVESMGAARKAVEIWKEKGGGSVGSISKGKMEIAIEQWEAESEFDKEIGQGVAHWIDVYLTDPESGTVSSALSVDGAFVEGKEKSRSRKRGESWADDSAWSNEQMQDEQALLKEQLWMRVRRGIVTLALKEDTLDLIDITNDRTHTMHEREIAGKLARVGLLCAAHRHVSVSLARCGARLIENAIEQGVFTKGEDGAQGDKGMSSGRRALLWRRLAECHAVVAAGEGYGREINRWLDSKDAWKQALTHIECATDVHCWESHIHVLIQTGDYAEAAQTVGVLMRSFKPRAAVLGSVRSAGEGKGGSYMMLLAASLLLKMGSFEQSHAYIVKILEKANEQQKVGGLMDEQVNHIAPPAPLTYLHLTFMASRCYDEWGKGGGGEGPANVAKAGYNRSYRMMLKEHDGNANRIEAVIEGNEGDGDEAVHRSASMEKKHIADSAEAWLGAFETWRQMALHFHSAGLDLFAADLMNQAVKLLPRRHDHLHSTAHVSGRRGSKVGAMAEHYGEAPLEFWVEAAQIHFKSGDEEMSLRMLEVAGQKFPDSRRVSKALRQLKGEKAAAGMEGEDGDGRVFRLKKMKKKSTRELCDLVLANIGSGVGGISAA